MQRARRGTEKWKKVLDKKEELHRVYKNNREDLNYREANSCKNCAIIKRRLKGCLGKCIYCGPISSIDCGICDGWEEAK